MRYIVDLIVDIVMATCNNYLKLPWIFVSFPESKAWRKLDKVNIRNILRVEKEKGNEMKDQTKPKPKLYLEKSTKQTRKKTKNNNKKRHKRKKQITPSPPHPQKKTIIGTHWMLNMFLWFKAVFPFWGNKARQRTVVPVLEGMVPRCLLGLR